MSVFKAGYCGTVGANFVKIRKFTNGSFSWLQTGFLLAKLALWLYVWQCNWPVGQSSSLVQPEILLSYITIWTVVTQVFAVKTVSFMAKLSLSSTNSGRHQLYLHVPAIRRRDGPSCHLSQRVNIKLYFHIHFFLSQPRGDASQNHERQTTRHISCHDPKSANARQRWPSPCLHMTPWHRACSKTANILPLFSEIPGTTCL